MKSLHKLILVLTIATLASDGIASPIEENKGIDTYLNSIFSAKLKNGFLQINGLELSQ